MFLTWECYANTNLNEIMESIDDYGDTIKEALRVQQAIEAEEELESGEQDQVSTKSSLPSPRARTS